MDIIANFNPCFKIWKMFTTNALTYDRLNKFIKLVELDFWSITWK